MNPLSPRSVTWLALLTLLCCGPATTSPGAPSRAKAQLSSGTHGVSPLDTEDFLHDYIESGRYRTGEPTSLTPSADGKLVLCLRRSAEGKNGLWETDVTTGKTHELLRPEAVVAGDEHVSPEERARRERQRMQSGGFTFFEATPDGAVVIVGLSGRLFTFTRADGQVRELPAGQDAIDPQLSPDATRIAYVRGNDVHVLSIATGNDVPVTRGGTELRPNGLAEFMAQEEFGRNHGFWWSPDGSELLVEQADLSPVPVWTYADPAHPENPPRAVRYPKTGAPNAIVRLAFASARNPGNPLRFITWDTRRYPYVTNVIWSKNAPPTIDVRSRDGQHASILAIDEATGSTRPLVIEDDPAWVNLDSSVPRWLPDGQAFLWSTERNGAFELELRGRDGKRLRTVSAPGAGYRRVVAVDAERRLALFMTSPDAVRNELWAASLDGTSPPHEVARREGGTVWATFGSSSHVFASAEASLTANHEFVIRSVDGDKPLATIPSLARTPPFMPAVELRRLVQTGAQVAIVRPRVFDPRRRYPVIDSIYGGPLFNVVKADAHAYLEPQWLADSVDAIVVLIDARGSDRRDRAWQRAAHGHLATLAVDEHADAIRELAKLNPEMDPDRVGIYGWSNGGTLSAMAVLRRPDFFKAAVAGAPLADLRDYDAIMEFFSGSPPNAAFDEASVLAWAAQPPTAAAPARPLLLLHGTADDNVYFANSLNLANTMELAGRHAELVPLVGRTHMDGTHAASIAVLRRIAEHFRTHLFR